MYNWLQNCNTCIWLSSSQVGDLYEFCNIFTFYFYFCFFYAMPFLSLKMNYSAFFIEGPWNCFNHMFVWKSKVTFISKILIWRKLTLPLHPEPVTQKCKSDASIQRQWHVTVQSDAYQFDTLLTQIDAHLSARPVRSMKHVLDLNHSCCLPHHYHHQDVIESRD